MVLIIAMMTSFDDSNGNDDAEEDCGDHCADLYDIWMILITMVKKTPMVMFFCRSC